MNDKLIPVQKTTVADKVNTFLQWLKEMDKAELSGILCELPDKALKVEGDRIIFNVKTNSYGKYLSEV
jgi:hypothetical protein